LPEGFDEPKQLLVDCVQRGVCSATVLHVWDLVSDGSLVECVVGATSSDPDAGPVSSSSRFDLASLTKLVTSTVTLRLVASGQLDLDTPVVGLLGERLTPAHGGITPRALLNHTSGLPAWAPLWEQGDVLEHALSTRPEAPVGVRHRYSDIGFLWLGAAVEVAGGASLAELAEREVFAPLGMKETRYHSLPVTRAEVRGVVATEDCPERGLLVGEVSDRNTWHLGGVAPHAGLFGPVGDLVRFSQGWWDAPETGYLPRGLRDEAWGAPPFPGGHALGWDTVAPTGYTSAGLLLSRRSHGHLAFTGPSLWIDPDRGVAVALLCNRIHPSRDEVRLKPLRPALHDAVARAVDAMQ